MGKKRVALVEGQAAEQKEAASKKKRKKKSRVIDRAHLYIKASYNNTMITVTDKDGGTIAWATAGGTGFKGPRKATPYAASKVVDALIDKLERVDMKEVHIYVSGIGAGRDSAVRSLTNKGLNITAISDITPLPHNGCRPPKRRRV